MKATINKNGVEVSLNMTDEELDSLVTGIGKTTAVGLEKMNLNENEIHVLYSLYSVLSAECE